jgi:hypothetical protein
LANWTAAWAALALAALTCPKPIEIDFLLSIAKSSLLGFKAHNETFMLDLFRIGRELGANPSLPKGMLQYPVICAVVRIVLFRLV